MRLPRLLGWRSTPDLPRASDCSDPSDRRSKVTYPRLIPALCLLVFSCSIHSVSALDDQLAVESVQAPYETRVLPPNARRLALHNSEGVHSKKKEGYVSSAESRSFGVVDSSALPMEARSMEGIPLDEPWNDNAMDEASVIHGRILPPPPPPPRRASPKSHNNQERVHLKKKEADHAAGAESHTLKDEDSEPVKSSSKEDNPLNDRDAKFFNLRRLQPWNDNAMDEVSVIQSRILPPPPLPLRQAPGRFRPVQGQRPPKRKDFLESLLDGIFSPPRPQFRRLSRPPPPLMPLPPKHQISRKDQKKVEKKPILPLKKERLPLPPVPQPLKATTILLPSVRPTTTASTTTTTTPRPLTLPTAAKNIGRFGVKPTGFMPAVSPMNSFQGSFFEEQDKSVKMQQGKFRIKCSRVFYDWKEKKTKWQS